MKPKQTVKVCVDIAMILGLLFLMGYHFLAYFAVKLLKKQKGRDTP